MRTSRRSETLFSRLQWPILAIPLLAALSCVDSGGDNPDDPVFQDPHPSEDPSGSTGDPAAGSDSGDNPAGDPSDGPGSEDGDPVDGEEPAEDPGDPADGEEPAEDPGDPADGEEPAEDPGEEPPPATLPMTEPAPHAQAVPRQTEILIEFSSPLAPDAPGEGVIEIVGERSGRHTFVAEVGEEKLVLRLLPDRAFLPGESVRTTLGSKLSFGDDTAFAGASFDFRTRTAGPPRDRRPGPPFQAAGPPLSILAGDLDQDGTEELLYAVRDGSLFEIVRSRPDGALTPLLSIDVGHRILSMALADLDRDGHLDLLLGGPDRLTIYPGRIGTDGLPDSGEQLAFPLHAAVHAITAADLDHRGGIDLVLDTDEGLQVFLDGLAAGPSWSLGEDRQAESNVVAADLDLDGDLDLAYGGREANEIRVLKNGKGGPGNFSEPTSIAVGRTVETLIVEDLTGDGLPDLFVLFAEEEASPPFLLLARDATTGDFAPPDLPGLLDDPGIGTLLALGDLDGDGIPDTLFVSRTRRAALLYTAATPPSEAYPGSEGRPILELDTAGALTVADITGDGSLDVVVSTGSEIRTLSSLEEDRPPREETTFRYSMDSLEARAGDRGVATFVRATNTEPVDALYMLVGYPPEAVESARASFDGLITSEADFTAANALDETFATSIAVVLDLEPPRDRTLPPGEEREVVRLSLDVLESATPGETSLSFLDLGPQSADRNALVVGGAEIVPELVGGTLRVLEPEVPPPSDPGDLSVGTATVLPGEMATVPIRARLPFEADGFSLAGTYSASELRLDEFDLRNSFTATAKTERLETGIDPERGTFTLSVLFDVASGSKLPPGDEQLLASVRLRAREGTPPGTYPIALVDLEDEVSARNSFFVGDTTLFPRLLEGAVEVGEPPQPAIFLRGDVNSSGRTDVSDATFILNSLFRNGNPAPCEDAADANDDGRVNQADAVTIVGYFFGNLPPPPPPFPEPGVDPTADRLGCDAGRR